MDAQEVYDYVLGRLDMAYVRQTAEYVAAALRGRGEALGVAFQPGDGTRYDLAFVPIQYLRHAPGRIVRGELWPERTEFGISRVPGTAIVVYHQQGRAAGLDLRTGGFAPVYLAELYGTGQGSACTLAILFNTIAEVWGE